MVQGQDSFLEVFIIAVAVGAALQGSDFVVDPFEWAGRDGVVVPVEESRAMTSQGLGHRLHLADVRVIRPRNSMVQNESGRGAERMSWPVLDLCASV